MRDAGEVGMGVVVAGRVGVAVGVTDGVNVGVGVAGVSTGQSTRKV
jgi:hypothetical protein